MAIRVGELINRSLTLLTHSLSLTTLTTLTALTALTVLTTLTKLTHSLTHSPYSLTHSLTHHLLQLTNLSLIRSHTR